jgi:hypothetical protein
VNTIQFFINKNCLEAYDPMGLGHGPAGTDGFELQMALIDLGNGKQEWYGSLQNVNDEKKHYIKGWSGLIADLQKVLTPAVQLKVLNALLPIKDRYVADILRGNV